MQFCFYKKYFLSVRLRYKKTGSFNSDQEGADVCDGYLQNNLQFVKL